MSQYGNDSTADTTYQEKPEVKSREKKRRDRKTGWVIFGFLAPAMAFYFLYVVFAIFMTVYYSVFEWSGIDDDMNFIGFQNYLTMFADGAFWQSVGNNFLLVFSSLFTQLPLGLIMALMLFSPIKGIRFFRSIYFMPFLMSTVAIGILFTYIYDPTYGLVNEFLRAVGLGNFTRGWLGNEATAIWAIIVVVIWQFAPFYMILFRAAIVGIPEDLYEAADIDGATPWQRFTNVTLPLLMPTIITSSILSVIGALKYFDLIYVMTGGGPNNSTHLMATYMYDHAFSHFNMGYGSGISFSMFIIALIATIFILWFDRRRKGEF
ncbi:carbohydrate ABC transporter permease [Alkalicoccus chagannorensis]|uniref:carbohydrate ABC transporter permease n=1 Tax=Alkalicoccus chagannorensis TaxID=427072 RepID=UPI000424A74B|nr:sugar ABC transporter permease [Alkalicoccus chagannorensis]